MSLCGVRCLPTRRDQVARPKANPSAKTPRATEHAGTLVTSMTSLSALGSSPRGLWTCSPSPSLPQVPRARANPHPDSGFYHPPANTRHSSEGGRVTWL